MIEFIDKTAETPGTPLNRANMMALQGFQARTFTFGDDGSVTEIGADGSTKTTVFGDDGRIVETFVGEKTIVKTTIFNENGNITEALS
jgi:hypothetical protein